MPTYVMTVEFYAECRVPAVDEEEALKVILKSISNIGAPGLLEAMNIRRVRVTHIREEQDGQP